MPPLPSHPEVFYTTPHDEDYAAQMELFKAGEIAMMISQPLDEGGQPTHFFYPHGTDASEINAYAMMVDKVISMNATRAEHFGSFVTYETIMAERGLRPAVVHTKASPETTGLDKPRGGRLRGLLAAIPGIGRFL